MQINTQQLRTALRTAADNLTTGQENRPGDAKVANLALKNVDISSKGEVHVSKGGWNRMWAGLVGRPTGEAALRQAMTGKDVNGFNIPLQVADRALQTIAKHHGGSPATEPSRNRAEAIKTDRKAPDPARAGRSAGGHAAYHASQDAETFNQLVGDKVAASGLSDSDQSKLKYEFVFHPRDQARSEASPMYSAIREGIAKEVGENGLQGVMTNGRLNETGKAKAMELAAAGIDRAIQEIKHPPSWEVRPETVVPGTAANRPRRAKKRPPAPANTRPVVPRPPMQNGSRPRIWGGRRPKSSAARRPTTLIRLSGSS